MRTAMVLVLAASGLLATGASAQTAPSPAPTLVPAPAPQARGMLRADANGDGTITRAEYVAQAEARIAAMDGNKDGVISPEERAAARQAMWAARRNGDAGGDQAGGYGAPPRGDGARAGGKSMTRAELIDRATARFDRMDANHDGKLDAAERAAARSAMHHGRRGGGGADAGAPTATDAQ